MYADIAFLSIHHDQCIMVMVDNRDFYNDLLMLI